MALVVDVSSELTTWLRRVVGFAAPLVVWLYVAEGVRHAVVVQAGSQLLLWVSLGVLLVGQLGILVWAIRRGQPPGLAALFRDHAASGCLLLPTLGTLVAAAAPTIFGPQEGLPPWVLYVALALATGLSSMFILCVGGRTAGPSPPSAPPLLA